VDFLADYGEDYLKVLVVNVGAAHTREPRLSAASVPQDGECWSCAAEEVLAMGKIFFLRMKEGVWEEYHYLQCTHGVILLTGRVVP
jgi:hypothetical protein